MSKHHLKRLMRHMRRLIHPNVRDMRAMRRLGRIEGKREAERPLPPVFPACPVCLKNAQKAATVEVLAPPPQMAPLTSGVALASWLEQPTRDRLPAMTAQRGGVPPVLKGMRPVQHNTGKLSRQDVLEAIDTAHLNEKPLPKEVQAFLDTPPEQRIVIEETTDDATAETQSRLTAYVQHRKFKAS